MEYNEFYTLLLDAKKFKQIFQLVFWVSCNYDVLSQKPFSLGTKTYRQLSFSASVCYRNVFKHFTKKLHWIVRQVKDKFHLPDYLIQGAQTYDFLLRLFFIYSLPDISDFSVGLFAPWQAFSEQKINGFNKTKMRLFSQVFFLLYLFTSHVKYCIILIRININSPLHQRTCSSPQVCVVVRSIYHAFNFLHISSPVYLSI